MRCIWVLAGPNGSGKSSVAGEFLRQSGGDYFNPDEVARRLRRRDRALDTAQANAVAWNLGLRLLDRAIERRRDHYFETTLGGSTMASRLEKAMSAGLEVRIWYVGLKSPELNVARVAARVRLGGHAIPEVDVRRRFDTSRRNVIALLPRLSELVVYDNSFEADLGRGEVPVPKLLLHWRDRRIIRPQNLRNTPAWAKAIVAQALKHAETS